jgi:hypothetical protein
MDSEEETEEGYPLYMKLLEVCVDENNGAIVDAMPMFLASIFKDLPSSLLPNLLEELKHPTVEAHKAYTKWLKER